MRTAGWIPLLLATSLLAGEVASEPSETKGRGFKSEVRQFEMAYTAGKAGVTVRLTLATGRVVEQRVSDAADVETVAQLGAMFITGRARMFADLEGEMVLGLQVAGPTGFGRGR